ncbi:MAG: transglycosylase domain-containing protein, partial [Acidobacteriota bacterium]
MRRPEEEVITRKVEATGFSAAGKGQTGQLGMPGRVPILDQNASSSSRHRRRRRSRLIFRLALLALLAAGVLCELSTSRLQSIFLAAVDDDLSFSLGNGPSTRIRFPAEGPYDRRLGYARLPQMLTSLERAGFRITRQARLSDHLLQMIDAGVFPTYREKMQAGLRIVGRRQRLIHRTLSPFRVYKTFDEIPDLVIRSLLYVEDRSLLDTRFPHRNPVVAWPRQGQAVLDLIADGGPTGRHPIGGSTLATQIEKFRHARDGRTRTPGEKIQQMISAMLRVYLDGDRTTAARRRILRDYLNSVPLAALPQVGEIFGMGDGLAVWYGADLDETDDLLRAAGRWAIPSGRFRIQADLVHAGLVPGSGREGAPPPQDEIRRLLPASSTVHEQAAAFRRILSLILAHRRPTVLLNQDRNQLQDRVDDYLHLMARDGIITAMLRDEALKVRLDAEPVEGRKCGSAVRSTKIDRSLRAHLKAITGLASRYDLDHLDLTVGTTVDAAVQADVDDLLHRLSDPVFLRASGLTGRHLVDGGDPAQIVYGFTLYQRGRDANLLRVEADTYDHPFNVNEGLKLDLGSTAKLRTLISYLSIIARIHADYGSLHTADLGDLRIDTVDELTHWGVDYLKAHPGASLEGMLEAAMDRKYSASPRERFFTGGGLHRFSNFSHASDGRILTVRQAFARSVNLVFVRIMRDVINHLMVATAGAGPDDILAAGGAVSRSGNNRSHNRASRFARHSDRSAGCRNADHLSENRSAVRRVARSDSGRCLVAYEDRRRLEPEAGTDAVRYDSRCAQQFRTMARYGTVGPQTASLDCAVAEGAGITIADGRLRRCQPVPLSL